MWMGKDTFSTVHVEFSKLVAEIVEKHRETFQAPFQNKTRTDFVQRPAALTTYCNRKEPIKSPPYLVRELALTVIDPIECGLGTPDPTPKRNVVKEQQILIHLDGSHPEENYGWEIRGRANHEG